ncbi:MAG: ABC transporter substrate-binding protein, partial [[Clostridium] leptum]
MFKKLLAGLLAASLVLSLASCNNGGGETSSTESTGGDSSAAESTGGNEGGDGEYSGTLTIWEGDPTRAVCGDAYKAYFAEKYPNLEIKMETKTENTYQSALSSAFGANQGPDVFWNWGTKNGILESIVAEDYVMPLTDIADMSLFEKDGEKTMISGICYVDDVLYGVPTAAVDTRTIYYNKDIFEEHGYEPSTDLADFEAMCDQMLADGIQPLTVAATEYSSLFHVYDFILCACKGGPEFIKDTEAVKAKQN